MKTPTDTSGGSTGTPPTKITIKKAADRGRADHGWLQANHSFSFGSYFDPEAMGFGDLRVLNQDHIQGGGGFPTHPHQDMEIITWVQSGSLGHEDSMGNREALGPGEVQVMSAGRGIRHSEYNNSRDEPLELLQMWILPSELGQEPRWEQRRSPESERDGRFGQLVGPHAEAGRPGLLTIGQDARLYAALLSAGQATEFELPAGRRAYVHVATGSVLLDGLLLETGDGAAIEAHPDAVRTLAFRGQPGERADVVLWDLA